MVTGTDAFTQSYATPQAVIASARENVIYAGMVNHLLVAARAYTCSQLILLTDNGTVEHGGGECTFNLSSARVGSAKLRLCKVRRGDTIDIMRQIFRVRQIPIPTARIGGVHSGTIRRNVLRVQEGVIARIENFEIDARVLITCFTLFVLQPGGNCASYSTTNSPYFTEEMQVALGRVAAGDIVLATGIEAKLPDGSIRPLDSIQLSVSD